MHHLTSSEILNRVSVNASKGNNNSYRELVSDTSCHPFNIFSKLLHT